MQKFKLQYLSLKMRYQLLVSKKIFVELRYNSFCMTTLCINQWKLWGHIDPFNGRVYTDTANRCFDTIAYHVIPRGQDIIDPIKKFILE